VLVLLRAQASSPVAIQNNASGTPADSVLFGTSLSSSVGKSKKSSLVKSRRLSSTSSPRPGGGLSLPTPGFLSAAGGRGRSASTSLAVGEDDEEGEIKPGSRKPRGETYACEKCNKVSSLAWSAPPRPVGLCCARGCSGGQLTLWLPLCTMHYYSSTVSLSRYTCPLRRRMELILFSRPFTLLPPPRADPSLPLWTFFWWDPPGRLLQHTNAASSSTDG
jgi:hypothetical protein